MNNKIRIVYEPEREIFNGALFLLREPHTNEEPEAAFFGNGEWFKKVCSNINGKTRQQKRYYNRFCEMLFTIQKYNPDASAFTNIKLTGGGSVASKEYWEITATEKKNIIDGIIDSVEGLEYVFTCNDIFNSLDGFWSSMIEDGLKYRGENQFQMRKCIYRNITFFEILHPSRSPRIICK